MSIATEVTSEDFKKAAHYLMNITKISTPVVLIVTVAMVLIVGMVLHSIH